MGSLFTAIGKILNIKFLLIFLSIIFYIDLYFNMKYQVSFIENYESYINLKEILLITIFYLVTLNVVIPLLAFSLSLLGLIIRFLATFIYFDFLERILDFVANDDLEELSLLELKAIEENNSALMKSYELKLEKYHEIHAIYLFSFFIGVELLYLLKFDSFSTELIFNAVELLYFTGNDGEWIFNFIFLGIPCVLLTLFSLRYISSFKSTKIFNWVGSVV